jgi:hypothetical protein
MVVANVGNVELEKSEHLMLPLYDDGIYVVYFIEDLNYGFDRFG